MAHDGIGTREHQRRFPRYKLERDCKLFFGDQSLTGRISDISLGGAHVRMPLVASSYGKLENLRFRLVDVCTFAVDARWRSDKSIGLQFEEAAQRSPALRDLLSELDPIHYADKRDMTIVTSGFLPISS